MIYLFKSEFLRYRKWALLAMASLLVAFMFIARLKPFLQAWDEQTLLTMLVMVGGSLAFGIVQMYLHKRDNHWTYLIHRPLEPRNICLALLGAGAAAITVAVAIPPLVMILSIDMFSAEIVDVRQYAYVPFMLLASFVGYLIGTLSVLNASKGVILLTSLLALILLPAPASNLLQFLPTVLILSGLLYLNIVSFKPDLGKYFERPVSIILLAVPMMALLMIGVLMSSLATYHIPRFIMGSHPDNNPINGTHAYMWEYSEKDRPAYALETSSHPKAEHFIAQAKYADVDWISTERVTFGRLGQMSYLDGQYALEPSDTNTIWQFSHDSMLMEGREKANGKPVGVIGKNGFLDEARDATEADVFTSVPFLVGEKFLQTSTALYQVNFEERTLDVKYQAEAGEVFLNPPQFRDDFVALVTDKHILMFDNKAFIDGYEPAVAEYSVPIPAKSENIEHIWTYRMVDGYLLMFSGRHYLGFHRNTVEVVHAKLGGDFERIGLREFPLQRHPQWILFLEEMTSPMMHLMVNSSNNLIEPSNPTFDSVSTIIERQYPTQVYWFAALIHLFGAIFAFFWCRHRKLGKPAVLTWVMLNALFGLPAVFACILMTPFRAGHAAS